MSSPPQQMTPDQAIEALPPITQEQLQPMRAGLGQMLANIAAQRMAALAGGAPFDQVPQPLACPVTIDFGTLAVLTRDLFNARNDVDQLRFAHAEAVRENARLRALMTPARPAGAVEGLAAPPPAGGATGDGEGLRAPLAGFLQSVNGAT